MMVGSGRVDWLIELTMLIELLILNF
jgi:hypothetical protein